MRQRFLAAALRLAATDETGRVSKPALRWIRVVGHEHLSAVSTRLTTGEKELDPRLRDIWGDGFASIRMLLPLPPQLCCGGAPTLTKLVFTCSYSETRRRVGL
jgi:hypothetical protein